MIQVTVDGGAVDARRLEMHYQDNPYPGGARYTLSVADREMIELIGRRVALPARGLSREDTNWVFNMLRLHVSLHEGRDSPLFWANTVETISRDADTLNISGVCSRHVDGKRRLDDQSSADKNGEETTAALNDQATADKLLREADLAAIREGIADMNAGRVMPLEQLDARIRAKLGF